MRLRVVSRLALFGAAFATVSCRNLDRFDTHGDAAYCGDLVSGPSFHDGFIATGQPAVLRMKLTLDTSNLSTYSDAALPVGTLTSNDRDSGLCSSQGSALFHRAFVRGIPQVDHDAISSLSFGEGHDEDFFAWTDSTCQGTMLAVVSLLRNGDVELRLFKPAPFPDQNAGPAQRPGFAVFYLHRYENGCEF